MTDVREERCHGAAGQQLKANRTGQLYAPVNSVGGWEHASSQGSVRVSRPGKMRKDMASNGQIVCLFLWAPSKPNKGDFQLISSHCAANICWPFTAQETFKDRKETSSCCWPTGHIYSERVNMLWMASISHRMFGNHSVGTETLGHSSVPYLFSIAERCSRAVERQVKDLPVCE